MSKRIAIDVDLTTLESDVAWFEWLMNMTRTHAFYEGLYYSNLHDLISCGHKVDYDLTSYFGSMVNKRSNYYDFWRSTSVYDTIQPIEGASDAIHALYFAGWDIVFVTHNKGSGSKSKYNCLERHFGETNFKYVVTKEKYLVDADILIDDRHEFLNQFLAAGKQAFKLSTPYNQNVQLFKGQKGFIGEGNWDDFINSLT